MVKKKGIEMSLKTLVVIVIAILSLIIIFYLVSSLSDSAMSISYTLCNKVTFGLGKSLGICEKIGEAALGG